MFLPDGFKPEVIKFLETPAGKALVIALEQRKPAQPSSGETAHGMIQRYAIREGFEMALTSLAKIAHEAESPDQAKDDDPFKTLKD